ncbi:MAG TPA: ATP-binding protein [Saprospiraceae bacterium]|nr:ATP-binding protein [Saprospiraceae bacterium]HMP24859.1 ATP-binding protein [Saprospiraceae bacterium]
MKIIAKTPDLLARLQAFEAFSGLPEAPLQWLIERSEYRFYDLDEYLFKTGDPSDVMLIIMEGECLVEFIQQGEIRIGGSWETGDITGVLPFSRMKEAGADGRVLRPCYVLALHRQFFTEMASVSYEMTQALVAVMSDRVRSYTQLRSQNEKLIALGKISAGLAHELNNPASAMVRSADELYKRQHQTPERFKSVITMRITPEQTDAVNAILFAKIASASEVKLSLLEHEARKDDLLDWLDDKNIGNSEEIAETLVDCGFAIGDLEAISNIVNGQHLTAILRWIESSLSIEKLVVEIKESAERIASLVKAVKSYSHMDRGGASEPTEVYEGVRNTLTMLRHKLRQKRIQVEEHFALELPKVIANPGELNQVWTNLLDNAIDAMPEDGQLRIAASANHRFVSVEITDNGSGISEEDLTRIFDPFYTTKAIGEGSGMGLDIVKKIVDRHKGSLDVSSRPGETTFTVCLPVHLNAHKE